MGQVVKIELDAADAKDNKYLEPALAAGATEIMSGDSDLRVLHPWRGIPLLSPVEYIAFLEQRLARSF